MEEAGYGDGFTMEIAADSSASDTVTMALQVIKDQLAQIGITAEIKTYDESTWLDTRNSGELDVYKRQARKGVYWPEGRKFVY